MAIEDYIPNMFETPPVGYQGLLGAQESAALQRQANIQGLLGAAVALSSAGVASSVLLNAANSSSATYLRFLLRFLVFHLLVGRQWLLVLALVFLVMVIVFLVRSMVCLVVIS